MSKTDKRPSFRTDSLRAAKYQGDGQSRHVIWDDKQRGLGLRVYPPNGEGKTVKAFVLSYRFKGRKRLMAVGRFGLEMTVDEARDEAAFYLKLARDGTDPLAYKKQKDQGRTLRDLKEKFIRDHCKPHKRTWEADERRLDRLVPARWLSRDVTDINRGDILALHRKIGERTPIEANRLLENLKTMFNQARLWGFLPPGADNPAVGVKRFRETKRREWVRPEQLPALAKAIDQEQSIYLRATFWLYLLTGLRKSELLNAKWGDVDWKNARLRLPETKSGDEQSAALGSAALAILQAIPKQEGNPHILPGQVKGRPIYNVAKPWRRIQQRATMNLWEQDRDAAALDIMGELKAKLGREPTYLECVKLAERRGETLPTGLMNIRIHDLRRTAGSWMSQAGVDLNTIKDALRHAKISTTIIYAQLGADPARKAMEEHGAQVLAAAGKDKPGEVVTFARPA